MAKDSTLGAGFQPSERMVITTVEQLKAISDPLRLSILELITREALTVKQIAGRLNQPATKLYYHVAEMEKAGFVTMVDTRVKSGIIEKYYRAASDNITIDHTLLNGPTDQENPMPGLLSVIFDTTAAEIARSITSGLVKWEDLSTGKTSNLILMRTLFNLRKENIAKFMEKFSELLKELDAEGAEPGQDTISYGFTVAFYPRVTLVNRDQD